MLHHYGGNQSISSSAMASTFSLFFPLPKGRWPVEEAYDGHSYVTCPSSPSSSSTGSVDCTLSLGTPSSRRHEAKPGPAYGSPSGSAMSWDAVADSYYCQGKPTASAAKGVASLGPDPLLARRCANCGTASTPLWRNGPRGPKSLCNACGIRYKKEERRAAATAENGGGGGCGHSAQRPQQWECYGSASKAVPAVTYGENTLACGDGSEAPFLAWRLNVVPPAATSFSVWPAEWPSLFQYN